MRVSSARVRGKKSADGCGMTVTVSTETFFVSFDHVHDVISTATVLKKSAKWRCNNTSRGTRVATATLNTGTELSRRSTASLWIVTTNTIHSNELVT